VLRDGGVEFVESEAILEILGDLGVDYAQGYFVGRPKPLELTSDAGLLTG
jgi:EAL domain-containing protein (putative c-di-GMP-specific phosphodiesterase class I)